MEKFDQFSQKPTLLSQGLLNQKLAFETILTCRRHLREEDYSDWVCDLLVLSLENINNKHCVSLQITTRSTFYNSRLLKQS